MELGGMEPPTSGPIRGVPKSAIRIEVGHPVLLQALRIASRIFFLVMVELTSSPSRSASARNSFFVFDMENSGAGATSGSGAGAGSGRSRFGSRNSGVCVARALGAAAGEG